MRNERFELCKLCDGSCQRYCHLEAIPIEDRMENRKSGIRRAKKKIKKWTKALNELRADLYNLKCKVKDK